MSRRPLSITVLSWLFIAAGTVGLVYHASAFPGEEDLVDAIVVLLVRALAIVGGVFALRGVNWSRWLLLGWAAFHVVVSLPEVSSTGAHAVLLIGVWYVYFHGPAQDFFRRETAVGR